MSQERVRARVLAAGRVQGVFFRQETARVARSNGLDGWVRNLPDGRVEAALEGSRQAVEAVINWMHDGPPLAHVTGVEVVWEAPSGESAFRIRS